MPGCGLRTRSLIERTVIVTADNVEMQGIEFEIINDSNAAVVGIEKLSKALSNLKTDVGSGISAVSKAGAAISRLRKSLDGIDTKGMGDKLKAVSDAVNNLKINPSVKVPASLSKNIAALNAAVAGSDTGKIISLGTALQSMERSGNIKISSALPKNITELSTALSSLDASNIGKLSTLTASLTPLSELGKSQMNTFINQLKKLPEVINELEAADLDKFNQQMKDLTESMRPFADEMNKVSAGFSAFPSRIQRLITSTERYNNVVGIANSRTNSLANTMKQLRNSVIIAKIGSIFGKAVKKSAEYTEDLNLFTVSMGEYAKQAYEFANSVSEIVGIDPAQWMRNQGVFNTIITGFGVSGDKAAYMSQNLTQLAYDLSSFYNMDVASAMQKVQSGIAGELEPMRRLGYDLSVARLEQERLNLGITKSVSAMTQAEKSQLRYYTMMTQVTQVQGDMARTLEQPANMLRVLQMQFEQCTRAVGNLFIPILSKLLPWLIAITRGLREIIASVGALFGVTLNAPDWGSSFGGAVNGSGEIADNLSGAAGSAKELKNQLAGFDELNVIQSESGGGGGGAGAGSVGGFEDIELPGYDFLKDAVSSNIDKVYNKIKPLVNFINDNLQETLLVVGTIGATILAWKLSNKFSDGILSTKLALSDIHNLAVAGAAAVITIGVSYLLENRGLAGSENENWDKLVLSWLTSAGGAGFVGKKVSGILGKKAGLAASGVDLAISTVFSIKAIFKDVEDGGIDLKTVADSVWTALKGAAAGGLIALAAGATFAVGASIGAGLTLAGIGISVALAKAKLDTRETKWGNLELTKEQITEYVQEQLFSIDVTATIGAVDSVISDLDSQKDKLNAAISDFNDGLTLVKFGVDKEGSYQKMLTALTGGATDGSYSADSILGQLENVTKQSGVAVKLGINTFLEDSDSRVELSNMLDTSDSIILSETQRMGRELADLLAKGLNDGLSANEQEMAFSLSSTLSRISQAAAQENINTEFLGNLAFSLADMSQGSFDSTVEQFATGKAQLREQYQALAISTLAGMRTRHASLTEIGTPEALTKADELKAEIDKFANNMTAYVNEAVERVSHQGAEMIAQRVREAFSEVITADEFEGMGLTLDLSNWFANMPKGEISTNDLANFVDGYIGDMLYAMLSEADYNSYLSASKSTGKSLFALLPQNIQSLFYSELGDFLSSDDVKNYLGGDYTTQVFESLGYDAWGIFSTAFADNTLNAQFGLSTGESVISGLSQNDWAGAGASDGTSYANGFLSAAKDAAQFSLLMTGKYYGNTTALRKKIKGYATGGYPKQGELFWAREDGAPEMVGKMGGNTAVANNEQIVTGISSGVSKGVSDANREQNALLREQNNLLRQLLQKQFTAQVSPSAEFGRVVAKSSRMYEKTYG